jgi:tetratricopeptide (TPR) repeat protein
MDVAFDGVEAGSAALERNMQSVLELDPEFVPALHQIGKYRWLIHYKLAESLQILEHAIALDPDNPWLRHTAMAVYLELGDEQAARAVAAGTPQSARTTGLLSLYAGDWRAAGRAAYGEAGWSYENCENWLASEALRDYAMKTGELGPAIALIKTKSELGNDPLASMWVCNVSPAVVLSQLLEADGHAEQALALRNAAISWSDANAETYAPDAHRVRAEALLLEGRQDAALEELTAAFRGGDYRFWWYLLRYDPLWQPLHGDQRFEAIAADVRRHIDMQRKELEALRRRGLIPPALRTADMARITAVK